MNLILFIAALIVSFIAVRVGAIAFQLTGLEWSLAKFQSLSCFSGTGFTTREAELIAGHPKRRKIASILMVLGNAGLVAMVATFANSIRPQLVGGSSWFSWIWAGFGPLINLLVIAAAVYGTARFFTRSAAARKLTGVLRSKVKASGIVEAVSFEELTVVTGGYGVVRAKIDPASPFANRTLAKSGLRDKDVTVLVINRAHEALPNPSARTEIRCGDRLLCFGHMDKMKQVFGVPASSGDEEFTEDELSE